MKNRKILFIVPTLMIAAGCAHNEQRQARYDDTLYAPSPYLSAGGARSPGGSASSTQQGETLGSPVPTPGLAVSTSSADSTSSTEATSAAENSSTDDGLMARQIQQSLAQDPTVVVLLPAIQIQPSGSTVSLSGQVGSQEIKDRIESMVKQTPGVTTVNNQLEVVPGTVATQNSANDSLAANSDQSTSSSNRFDNATEPMSATSRTNGESTIYTQTNAPDQSSLQSQEEPISATTSQPTPIAEASGTISAQTIAPGESTGDQQPITATSNRPGLPNDAQSETRIYAQTNAPGATEQTEQPISATSSRPDQNSQVYQSTNSSTGAQSDAYSTGESGAVNVTVQGSSQADRSVAQQISQELRADAGLASAISQLSISVADGKVSLRGNVRSEQQKRQIESAVQRVTGVASVDNQLHVGSTQSTPVNR